MDECTALIGAYHGSSTGTAHHVCSWFGSREKRKGCAEGKRFLRWRKSDIRYYPPKTVFTAAGKIKPEVESQTFTRAVPFRWTIATPHKFVVGD